MPPGPLPTIGRRSKKTTERMRSSGLAVRTPSFPIETLVSSLPRSGRRVRIASRSALFARLRPCRTKGETDDACPTLSQNARPTMSRARDLHGPSTRLLIENVLRLKPWATAEEARRIAPWLQRLGDADLADRMAQARRRLGIPAGGGPLSGALAPVQRALEVQTGRYRVVAGWRARRAQAAAFCGGLRIAASEGETLEAAVGEIDARLEAHRLALFAHRQQTGRPSPVEYREALAVLPEPLAEPALRLLKAHAAPRRRACRHR